MTKRKLSYEERRLQIYNWRKNNPDKVQKYRETQKNRIKNETPEKIVAYKEKRKQQIYRWAEANPDKVLKYRENAKKKYREMAASRPKKERIMDKYDSFSDYSKEWRENNKEKIKVYKATRAKKVKESGKPYYVKEVYEANKPIFAKAQKKWIQKNREHVREYQRKWYAKTHPDYKPKVELTEEQKLEKKEQKRQRSLAYAKNYYLKHKEKILKDSKKRYDKGSK